VAAAGSFAALVVGSGKIGKAMLAGPAGPASAAVAVAAAIYSAVSYSYWGANEDTVNSIEEKV
jgi:hypothetical protein